MKKLKFYDTIYYYNPENSQKTDPYLKQYQGHINYITQSWLDSLQIEINSLRVNPWHPYEINTLQNCLIISNINSVINWVTFKSNKREAYIILSKNKNKINSMNLFFSELFFDLKMDSKDKSISFDC